MHPPLNHKRAAWVKAERSRQDLSRGYEFVSSVSIADPGLSDSAFKIRSEPIATFARGRFGSIAAFSVGSAYKAAGKFS